MAKLGCMIDPEVKSHLFLSAIDRFYIFGDCFKAGSWKKQAALSLCSITGFFLVRVRL